MLRMTEPAPLSDPLITTFGRLVEVYSRLERSLGRALEDEGGLPHTWFEVLLRLARSADGQLTMGDLAEQIALTSGGVTRLVDRMEAAGYVERRPCPTDRRVQYAAVTLSGRQRLGQAAKVHACNLRAAFARLTDQQVRTLDALLDRLRPEADPGVATSGGLSHGHDSRGDNAPSG